MRLPTERDHCVLSSDVDTLLDAVRSLLQQNHDLRADEGELNYEVHRVGVDFPTMQRNTLREAVEYVLELHRLGWADTYEIVAVRRLVVQTIRDGKPGYPLAEQGTIIP